MSRIQKKNTPKRGASRALGKGHPQPDFDEVVRLIEAARTKAVAAVNASLIDLYWKIGAHITRKVGDEGWGHGTVEKLANHIQQRQPGASGFSARNLWRMMQFFETYRRSPKLSPLVTELTWTHNLMILSRCKSEEEREFYLRVCRRERWSKRELERQLAGALFERVLLSPAKLSPAVTVSHPAPWTSSKTAISWNSSTFRTNTPKRNWNTLLSNGSNNS